MVTDTTSPSPERIARPRAGNLDDFGLRVRRARRDLVLTIQGFSTASGIPTSTLKNYELGHSKPTAENLQKMYAAGVNPMWVLLGHNPVLLFKPKFTPAQKAKLLLRKKRADALAAAKTTPPVNSEEPTEPL
ncbi:helix-turn-helix domain-containing protein [Pseudomonas sp. PLMAX]|uniref:helix-turn-helix domain-containing protein n=1 Tax=Pseudomonas sp. PLMAX TaxID=2201998 RepID=UPI0038BD7DE4